MKILFKTLALSAVIALASCSKDDSDDNNGGNNGGNNSVTLSGVIEGSWEITDLEQLNGTLTMNGQKLYDFYGTGRDFVGQYKFNSDGSLDGEIAYTMDQTTKYPGLSGQTQSIDVPKTTISGSYSVISNTEIAAVGPSGETGTYTVSNLTANTMTWSISHSVSQTQNGQSVTNEFDLKISFKKK